ncbi:hypothetical protein G6O67_000451 [Ophiocordyceps sinensis]|uniref:Uncharacterized protein n=2 Tax=Ophiocordyceps sinensis TaxID=72228 RepID=A0A8H4V9Z6_9HYPO|nr:hypothetical protein OCS_00317 [Ophiocordyceps sinensis CO18]KAF4513141.1 hypothetical protein G6O67_000451 [Ophiocordyceps sinensis]
MEKPLFATSDLRVLPGSVDATPTVPLIRRLCYGRSYGSKATAMFLSGPLSRACVDAALKGLRVNTPTIDDWKLLCTRVQASLTLAEVACFDGAARIYSTNAQVREFNRDQMERLHSRCMQVRIVYVRYLLSPQMARGRPANYAAIPTAPSRRHRYRRDL